MFMLLFYSVGLPACKRRRLFHELGYFVWQRYDYGGGVALALVISLSFKRLAILQLIFRCTLSKKTWMGCREQYWSRNKGNVFRFDTVNIPEVPCFLLKYMNRVIFAQHLLWNFVFILNEFDIFYSWNVTRKSSYFQVVLRSKLFSGHFFWTYTFWFLHKNFSVFIYFTFWTQYWYYFIIRFSFYF
mgnify:CR=1 FL=1